VHGQYKNEEVIYSIKDNGAGFEMEFVQKIFDAFQRLHNVQEFEGSGIGLAIVQHVISRHGGRIWAEGEPNKGAVFHFALQYKEIN
jgi:light-regulated signal transduction histidine kinase (bacteriophytochrome)